MTKITFEKFTSVTKEKIFDVLTDYKSFQNFIPEFYPSVRIISERATTTLAEVHLLLSGKKFVSMQKHVIEKPFVHETFFVGGDAKGTYLIENYESTSEGTKITLTVDFKYKGSLRFSGFFGGGKIEKEFSIILGKLIEIAEN